MSLKFNPVVPRLTEYITLAGSSLVVSACTSPLRFLLTYSRTTSHGALRKRLENILQLASLFLQRHFSGSRKVQLLDRSPKNCASLLVRINGIASFHRRNGCFGNTACPSGLENFGLILGSHFASCVSS